MRFGNRATFAFAFLLLGSTSISCGNDDADGGGDDDATPSCEVATDACVDDCIVPECGAEIDACSDDATCDAAKDTLVSCVCDAQAAGGTTDACFSAFTASGGPLSDAFADCAAMSCAGPCDF